MKLGIKISEASVAKYMVRNPKPPSQTWRTFLNNHISQLASVDFFTVHTVATTSSDFNSAVASTFGLAATYVWRKLRIDTRSM
jgi:hypothetical protein